MTSEFDYYPSQAVFAFLNAGYELSDFPDAYCGDYCGGLREYAEEQVESMGWYAILEENGINSSYFDLAAFTNDLDYEHWTAPSGHGSEYVFRSV